MCTICGVMDGWMDGWMAVEQAVLPAVVGCWWKSTTTNHKAEKPLVWFMGDSNMQYFLWLQSSTSSAPIKEMKSGYLPTATRQVKHQCLVFWVYIFHLCYFTCSGFTCFFWSSSLVDPIHNADYWSRVFHPTWATRCPPAVVFLIWMISPW